MYNIETKVIRISSGQKAIIVANKETPYKPKFDVYNRKEISPINDYLIFILKSIKNDTIKFSGLVDVCENELEKFNW